MADALVVEKKAEEPAVEQIAAAAEAPSLQGYTILVVDDEPDILEFLSAVLGDNGAKVLSASDGERGLELARQEKPDLMTLDLSMPGKDGGEVAATEGGEQHDRPDQLVHGPQDRGEDAGDAVEGGPGRAAEPPRHPPSSRGIAAPPGGGAEEPEHQAQNSDKGRRLGHG